MAAKVDGGQGRDRCSEKCGHREISLEDAGARARKMRECRMIVDEE